jgi:ribosomal subunit interface protein
MLGQHAAVPEAATLMQVKRPRRSGFGVRGAGLAADQGAARARGQTAPGKPSTTARTIEAPMETPLQISFRDMDPSPSIEARIREKAAKLERFFDRITSCRVVVEARNRHQRSGRLYIVRIDLRVPGAELVAGHGRPRDHAHEDVYVAIRDAFDAAGRQLEDHARRFRAAVKQHDAPAHGRVTRLFPDYGFVETSDGQEVYFHRNSVVEGSFERLEAGDEVRLVVAEGEGTKGAQASSVIPIGKHHPQP